MTGRLLNPDELVLAHAAGLLPQPVALAVAAQLALNSERRRLYRALESVGGGLIEAAGPEDLAPDALDKVLARLDEPYQALPSHPPWHEDWRALPPPLWRYIPDGLAALPWTDEGEMREVALDASSGGFNVSLCELPRGVALPRHRHRSTEILVVLLGAFRDEAGLFERGDLIVFDRHEEHQPASEPAQDCLCLAVTDQHPGREARMEAALKPLLEG